MSSIFFAKRVSFMKEQSFVTEGFGRGYSMAAADNRFPAFAMHFLLGFMSPFPADDLI